MAVPWSVGHVFGLRRELVAGRLREVPLRVPGAVPPTHRLVIVLVKDIPASSLDNSFLCTLILEEISRYSKEICALESKTVKFCEHGPTLKHTTRPCLSHSSTSGSPISFSYGSGQALCVLQFLNSLSDISR